MEYLLEEVLEHQVESIQAFLLQTAILNRLTGSLCDALTGHDNGQAMLELLEHANLFIVPLDGERRLLQVQELCQQRVRFANQSGMSRTAVAGWLLAIWGEVLAEINDLEGAYDLLEKSVKMTESGGMWACSAGAAWA